MSPFFREMVTPDKEPAELDMLISEKVTEDRHARTLLSMHRLRTRPHR